MKKITNLLIVIGFILGIFGGLFLPNIMQNISFLGNIYINLLKFLIAPLLFTSVALTIYEYSDKKYKFLIKTICLFVILFVISYLITSLIVFLVNPAHNFVFTEIAWNDQITTLKFSEIITNLFPNNIVSIFQNNMIFTLILFAVVCGIALGKIKTNKPVVDLFISIKELFIKLLEYVMFISPLGVFTLMGNAIATNGISTLLMGLKYILVAYLASIIVLFLVMILPVWIIKKISPIVYIKKIYKVWLVSLTTCSSLATLPYTIKCCENDFNVSSKTTNLTVPLGCTIHMCGGAVSFALLGIFSCTLYGISISFGTYIMMLILATLINMAAPGIPNGGIVLGATFISLFGIPLDFIGFYSGIYKVLDMVYTTLNVTGDVTASILLDDNL